MNWLKKHKILTVIIAFVLIGVVTAASSGSSDDSTNMASSDSGSQAEQKDESEEATPKIGSPVRDGKFEMTITAFECGIERLVTDAEYNLFEKPQGQFCVMDITVSNIGNEAQSFSYDDQKIFSADSLTFSPDIDTISIEGNGDIFYEQINPGNKLKGQIAYDVPVGANISKAELHDSFLSDGIEVDLTQ